MGRGGDAELGCRRGREDDASGKEAGHAGVLEVTGGGEGMRTRR